MQSLMSSATQKSCSGGVAAAASQYIACSVQNTECSRWQGGSGRGRTRWLRMQVRRPAAKLGALLLRLTYLIRRVELLQPHVHPGAAQVPAQIAPAGRPVAAEGGR